MKTCPVCGESYSDRIDFCFQDGTVLAAAPSAMDAPMPRHLAPSTETPISTPSDAWDEAPTHTDDIPLPAMSEDDDATDAPPIPARLKRDAPPMTFTPAAIEPVEQVVQPTNTPVFSDAPPEPTITPDFTEAAVDVPAVVPPPAAQDEPLVIPPPSVAAPTIEPPTDPAPAYDPDPVSMDDPTTDAFFEPPTTAPVSTPNVTPVPVLPSAGPVVQGFDADVDEDWIEVRNGPTAGSLSAMRWMFAISLLALFGGVGVVLSQADGAPNTTQARIDRAQRVPATARDTREARETEVAVVEEDVFEDEPVPAAEPEREAEPREPKTAARREAERAPTPEPAPRRTVASVTPKPRVAPAAPSYVEQVERTDRGLRTTSAPTPETTATVLTTARTEAPTRSGTALVFFEGRDGASLVVDGVTRGVLPARIKLSEGAHTFVIKSDAGSTTVERDVSLREGGVTVLRLHE